MRVRVRFGAFLAGGLVLACCLAFFVSPSASSAPDGLDRVAVDARFDDAEASHALDDLPTAGYAIDGVDDRRLSTGSAGLLGVLATFAIAGGLVLLARRVSRGPADPAAVPAPR